MADPVLVERRDGDGASAGIVTVTLNRPDKLNALDKPMWQMLGDELRALAEDETVRCIVLRGAGEDFCVGQDIDEFETEFADPEAVRAYGYLMRATYASLTDCPHPMVALVEGRCVGGGLEIALACDLRIAAASARLGLPVVRRGIALAYPFMETLLDVAGRANALEIMLEAQVYQAEVASEKGLLTRVVDDAAIETEAYAAARRIAEGAPLAHRWNKKFLNRLKRPDPVSDAEFEESIAWTGTEDFREGYRAFLEKRAPEFTGR